ncbi:MAG: DUF2132 domain-containing protein [Bacteriovoracaceae bacterium]|nr:DUF2132 domain-containing protein [Bacteriovoracaceae bacterium]
MINPERHNILDGVTLKAILEELVNSFGFEELGKRTGIRCFIFDPSINSSLKVLRKNLRARVKVENLYVELKKKK